MVYLNGPNLNLKPVPAGRLQASEDPTSTNANPRIKVVENDEDGSINRCVISKRAAYAFFKNQNGSIVRVSLATTSSQLVSEVLTFLNAEFSRTISQTSVVPVDKEFEYNSDRQLSKATYYSDTTKTTIAGTKEFTYNSDGKLTNITGTGIFKDSELIYNSDGLVEVIDIDPTP